MTNVDERGKVYADQAHLFLAQANEELERDDLRQASEKGWGAAAQIVKAVAETRALDDKGHGQLIIMSRILANELGEDDIRKRFNAGAELHTNFYEGYYVASEIAERLELVAQLVDRLEPLLTGRNGASTGG